MSKITRFSNILLGLGTLFISLCLLAVPKDGIEVVMFILSLAFTVFGIRTLVLYFTMAKHMVGGKSILYLGLIILDFGLISASMLTQSKLYIVIYLIAMHAFYGVVSLLRAKEERTYGVTSKKKLLNGLINIAVAISCLFFMGNMDMLIRIYAVGLIFAAAARIYSGLRKEDIVYVQ